ncbi:MAG: hypothetical protein Ct9H90mP10_05660 [Actinomycetota bacterium]|nr:MAG: hypothetical protein Ct9H90mP10_05660 [Actinomycetota bacterium]
MIDLNDRFALDGRDPNSYSGVFWILGRYDRAWGPERPIYGKIRYMTSKSTATKFNLKPYLEKWSVGSKCLNFYFFKIKLQNLLKNFQIILIISQGWYICDVNVSH